MTLNSKRIGLLCGCLLAATAQAQTTIENFEYASDADLLAAWTPQLATLSLSPWVAAGSTGTNSLRVERAFGTSLWEFEMLTPQPLATPMSIGENQYVTFRVTGEPQFTNASYQTLFLYAFDGNGNFGRWGDAIPTKNTNWYVFNFVASGIQLPWGSPGLPDLSNIVKFQFYLFGQGDPAGSPFSATIYIDDIMTRDTPLVETPPATFGPAMIEDFEYPGDTELAAAWTPLYPGLTTLSLSTNVAAKSTGTKSLHVERTFGSVDWETEVITGPVREIPMGITGDQYLTLRVSGDPQFTNASWQTLYLYAYDGAGNFARWGSPVPTKTGWDIFNFPASGFEYTWDRKGDLNLSNIVQFKFFLYGQGSPAGAPYTAALNVDEVQVRNTPLIEFPPASPMRTLIDDFESYADDAALSPGFYAPVPSGATATPSLTTPAPQGNKALKLSIDFTSIQYPWAAVASPILSKFAFPANGAVQLKFKGDPAMAAVVDDGTSFWLEFFDESGRRLCNTQVSGAAVANGEWTTVSLPYGSFWPWSTPVDTGNLVQWRLLVEGWTGDPASLPAPMTGVFYLDDIKITVPPTVAIVNDAGTLKLQLSSLISGTTYTIRSTSDFAQWTTTTINATGSTATWTIPSGQQKGFFQVLYTP